MRVGRRAGRRLQLELGEQQRADVHEWQDLAVDFSDVEQVEVVLYLVELQPHLDLAAGGERELLQG